MAYIKFTDGPIPGQLLPGQVLRISELAIYNASPIAQAYSLMAIAADGTTTSYAVGQPIAAGAMDTRTEPITIGGGEQLVFVPSDPAVVATARAVMGAA